MFKPLIGVVNGTTVCLVLERDNVLEDAEGAVWPGGPREYAGGASSCSGGGVGSYITQVSEAISLLQNEGEHTNLSRSEAVSLKGRPVSRIMFGKTDVLDVLCGGDLY